MAKARTRTIFQADNVKAVIDYYWDSHGRLVDFPYRGSYQDEVEGEIRIEDSEYGWKLFLNGEELAPIVYGYGVDEEGTIWIDGVIGWG